MQTDEAPSKEKTSDQFRVFHLVCQRCVPEIPPLGGPPFPRWCGAIHPLRSEQVLLGVGHPEACVVCANLETCAACGADRSWCH